MRRDPRDGVPRRLVITVCPREPGVVAVPVERGGRRERMDALGIAERLRALVSRRGLASRVRVQAGCSGGCAGPGPNVSVTVLPMPAPGVTADNVAVGWRSYVGGLEALGCLAAVIDDNIGGPDPPRVRRQGGAVPPRRQRR